MKGNLIILAGHYKGIDQRIRDHLITREISIGDFVLTGGELVAAMIADAIVRVVPGVIGDEQSALSDCFQDDILAAPIYTRPADYKGWKVPEILLEAPETRPAEGGLEYKSQIDVIVESFREITIADGATKRSEDGVVVITQLRTYHRLMFQDVFGLVSILSCNDT